ncbi:hypothetical protein [Acanthopleuribacter pedis]|uniref:Transmembrane protein n=1 Tax=Acanthopleuribacter pedis TaxID=442870 RepID=A0A8J7QCE1_9BACT|nr:hypothetical protein [Acanthopleuribacter pedis]MBO1323116.1 hypothetical protein [Acanthopleuribacter pedis]
MKDYGFFEHSGQTTPYGPVVVATAGLLSAPLLAFIYATMVHLFPYILVKFLLLFGFILALTTLLHVLSKATKIRNPGLVLALGLVTGITAWYGSWVALLQVMVEGRPLVWHPLELFAFAQYLADNGRWEFSDKPLPAILTWSIWGVEAMILIFTISIYPWDQIRNLPYCEDCSCWVDADTQIGPFAPAGDVHTLKHQIEGGDLSGLLSLQPSEDQPFWLLKLRFCNQCEDLYLANLVSVTLDDEGDPDANDLIRNFYISRTQYDQLWDLDKPADFLET